MESVWGGMEGMPSFPNRTALVRSDDRVDAGPLPESNKNTIFCLCSLLQDSPSQITSIFSPAHGLPRWSDGVTPPGQSGVPARLMTSRPWFTSARHDADLVVGEVQQIREMFSAANSPWKYENGAEAITGHATRSGRGCFLHSDLDAA